MSKKSDDSAPLHTVFVVVGIGLVVVGLLELGGFIGYRPNRQPVGAPAWFVAGATCLVISAVMRGWRK